jgi:hypothetical protein
MNRNDARCAATQAALDAPEGGPETTPLMVWRLPEQLQAERQMPKAPGTFCLLGHAFQQCVRMNSCTDIFRRVLKCVAGHQAHHEGPLHAYQRHIEMRHMTANMHCMHFDTPWRCVTGLQVHSDQCRYAPKVPLCDSAPFRMVRCAALFFVSSCIYMNNMNNFIHSSSLVMSVLHCA